MLFQGYRDSREDGENIRPVFSPEKRIIAFDVEGVLVLPAGCNGNGGYKLNKNACCVIQKALDGDIFDEVVFWSTSHRALGMADFYVCDAHRALQHHFPLDRIHQRVGGSVVRDGKIAKPLEYLSQNLSNVVAIEDDDFFEPRDRVIQINNGDFLLRSYLMAKDMVGYDSRKLSVT